MVEYPQMINFSVIIPTYNRATLLNELLSSLICQTYKNFELIICDDGSTDSTHEVVKTFESELNIKYVKSINSGGPAHPRNLGIEAAENDWVCFLDSDDLWTNNKLEILAENIQTYSAEIYCHPVYLLNDNQVKQKSFGFYRKGIGLNDFESLAYNGSQVVNSSLCVKRSILSESLYFDTNPKYKAIEDYIFLLKLTHRGYHIRTIKEVLGYYRVHNNNISGDLSRQIQRWRYYFGTKPFSRVDYDKIDSLVLYLEATLPNLSRSEKVSIYMKLTFYRSASFEIKSKALCKFFLALLN